MKKRKLGNSSLEVSAIRLGCMGRTGAYGRVGERQEMISLVGAAVERSVPFFDAGRLSTTVFRWKPASTRDDRLERYVLKCNSERDLSECEKNRVSRSSFCLN